MFDLEEHEYVVSYVAADGSKRVRWMTAAGRAAVRQNVLAEGGSVIYIRRDDDDYEAARWSAACGPPRRWRRAGRRTCACCRR